MDELPEDWAVWRSPDGWVVGEVWDDAWDGLTNLVFAEKGRGPTVAEAIVAAHAQEARDRERLLEQEKDRLYGMRIGDVVSDAPIIGEPVEAIS
jgi:hypothetical protein